MRRLIHCRAVARICRTGSPQKRFTVVTGFWVAEMIRHTQSVHRVGIACFGGKTIPRHLFFVLLPDFSLWLFFGIFQIPKLCRLLPKRDICVCKLRIGKGDNRLNTSAVGGTAKILSCQFFIVKAAVFVKINRCRAQQSVNLPRFNGFVKPPGGTGFIIVLFA